MTRKIFLLISLFLFALCSAAIAQDEDATTSYKDNLKIYKYKKHNSEAGINAGYFWVAGDVQANPGWMAGLHYRRAIDFAFSWRLDFNYGQAYGLDAIPANGVANNVENLANLGYGDAMGAKETWFPNYQTSIAALSLDGIWSLNPFNFKKSLEKWNLYVLGGIGGSTRSTKYDATPGNMQPYGFNALFSNSTDFNNKDQRKDVRDAVKDLLDGDYETEGDFVLGRGDGSATDPPTRINFHGNVGAGISLKLSDRINVSLEHKITYVFGKEGDLLDGYRWDSEPTVAGTIPVESKRNDLANYTNLRLNFVIGPPAGEDRLPPLYWTSSNDLLADDIAATAERVDKALRDSDNDGVFDMFDQEENTPEGATVDTRGATLDSDRDGVADYQDKEPHSPPGYEVDADGVAQIPDPGYTTEDDVNRIVDAKLAEFRNTLDLDPPNWFLPLINFAFNNYTVRESEYGKMHQVATVLKENPKIRLVAVGYADRPASDCYNELLSYNRAESAINYLTEKYSIARNRLVLDFKGETEVIVDTKGKSSLNRRVEFRVAKAADSADKAKPDCENVKEAGKGKKTGYSGEKSGY